MQATVISHSCGVLGIRLNSNDESLASHTIELVRNVLDLEPCVSIKDNTFEIRSGRKRAILFFLSYNFPEGEKARNVQVPKQILRTTDPTITKAFLRGLFSTDGYFSVRRSDNSPRIDIVIRSRLLRDQLMELASKVGFNFNKCDAKRVRKGFTEG